MSKRLPQTFETNRWVTVSGPDGKYEGVLISHGPHGYRIREDGDTVREITASGVMCVQTAADRNYEPDA